MWLNVLESQGVVLRITAMFWHRHRIADQTTHDCVVSQSRRFGQPAATQARNSSARHNVERPMRTGRGILPAESQLRHVRTDFPHVAAACCGVRRSGISNSLLERRQMLLGTMLSLAIVISFMLRKVV